MSLPRCGQGSCKDSTPAPDSRTWHLCPGQLVRRSLCAMGLSLPVPDGPGMLPLGCVIVRVLLPEAQSLKLGKINDTMI